jgi:ABC-type transport system involved in multi-copper enzyme maturation permease subunit
VIEMAQRFLRQRFGSVAMAVALGVLALLSALMAAFSEPEQALGTGFLAILLIAAGSVSRDVSGGTIQMILARPIRRTSYLFGRYLGILSAYGVFLVVAAALAVLFSNLLPRAFGAAPNPVSVASLARGVVIAMANALLFAAILLFFSTFLRGYADVLAYFLLAVLLRVMAGLGAALHRPALTRAGEAIRENVLPDVPWDRVVRGQDLLGEATGRWVLAVVAFLVLAAVVFSRREFSYGQD